MRKRVFRVRDVERLENTTLVAIGAGAMPEAHGACGCTETCACTYACTGTCDCNPSYVCCETVCSPLTHCPHTCGHTGVLAEN